MSESPLERNSKEPLHLQLRKKLTAKIEQQEWKPGHIIPREFDLMETYGLSRYTVRQAIDDLVQIGLLTRHKRRGTFVTQPRLEQNLSRFYSFARDIAGKGLQPSSRVLTLEAQVADANAARALHLVDGDALTLIKRLRLVDNEPLIIETSWLPVKFFPDLAHFDWNLHPLYDLLQTEYRVRISRATEILEAVNLQSDAADLLKIESGSSAFRVERVTYGYLQGETLERPLEQRLSLIRGDRYRYRVELPATDLLK